MRLRSTAPLALACAAAAASIGGDVQAASFDEAPGPSRAQVTAALRALEPALARAGRKLARRAKGSIESAILGYAPGRFHPVVEGALPPRRTKPRCPAEMALVDGRFCVDKWEAFLVEKKPDGTTAPVSPYETPADGRVYVARSAPGVVPQAYLSAKQADAACHEAKKRLCAPVEWRAACGGSNAYAYPYGPDRAPGTCHDSGASPMLAFHADTMKRGWGREELNDPRNNQLEGTVAKTGAYPGCVNDYGAFDMVGNLDEWTSDPNGTFQGGYWLDTSLHGDGCAYRTIAHGAEYHDYSIGFRCCADAGE